VGIVPVRLSGGANDISITRPAGTAVALAVSGGYHSAKLDGTESWHGGRIASAGAEAAANRFEVQVSGGANRIAVSAA
jgi:hypothetical protein